MNYNALHIAARNRVGFRDVFKTKDYLPLDTDLLTTQSGLYVNTISEIYLRPEIIDQFLEFAEGFNVDAWDTATDYGTTGNEIVIVNVNGKDQAFVSKANATENNINKNPVTDSDFWETFLSFRLRQYRESAVHEVVNELTTIKELAANTPMVKNYDRLFYMNSVPQVLQTDNAFRCLNIIPNDINSIGLTISHVGLVLDTAQTVRFYLYHSDSLDALQAFDVVVAPGDINNFVWKELTDTNGNKLNVQSLSGSLNSGGLFVFGFYEDDISGNIMSWEYNYYLPIPTGVQGSGSLNYLAWQSYEPYYSFYPGFYKETSKPQRPQIGQYFDDGNYDEEIPFNIKLSISEDHTNVMIENIGRLDKLLQLKYAILILTDMSHSFRKNGDADKAKDIESILINRSVVTEDVQGGLEQASSQGVIQKYTLELKSAVKNLKDLTTSNFGLVQVF